MEVFTPTDSFYEIRSEGIGSVVNKRRNYENLRRSIQAHKNRLAVARLKKGKNLPNDDLTKNDNFGYCRQSTADTNPEFEEYRFRRHTQSSLNKIARPPVKYNSMNSSNSFDGRYDNEQLCIGKYDDLHCKVNQSMVRYNSVIVPKVVDKGQFSFGHHVPVNKIDVDSDELEKKIVEVLGKILLNKEVVDNLGSLSQEPQVWSGEGYHDDNYDKVVNLLTKCISTTLNSAANDSCDNLSSGRTNKSVNVSINLNMPQSGDPESGVTVNMQNEEEDVGEVFIENVFDRDTKVKKGVFENFFGKFKDLYAPCDKGVNQAGAWKSERVKVDPLRLKEGPQNWDVGVKQVGKCSWDEDRLWKGGDQSSLSRNITMPGPVFRPFSRSRSQSVCPPQRGLLGTPVVSRTNSLSQNANNRLVRRNRSPVAPNVGQFDSCFDNSQRNDVVKNNRFVFQESSDGGVDHTFNPFNLPQPLKNPQVDNSFNQAFRNGKFVYGFDNMPVLNRNQRDGTGNMELERNFVWKNNIPVDFTGRFERRGEGCFEGFEKGRQVTGTKLQRTFNMNKKLIQPRVFTGHMPQHPVGRVFGPPPTPMGFAKVKRMNTEPRNFSQCQVTSPAFVKGKQLTSDVNFKGNRQVPKVRLMKTTSVIDTLNRLSELNTNY